MGKKVLRITFGLSKQRLSLCLTKNSYTKEMKKLASIDNDTFQHACTTTIFGEDIEDDRYVMGLNTDVANYTTLQIEALLVHELNHVVTRHMDFHSFNCDEYRSTLLQQLYIDTKPFLDNYLSKKRTKVHKSTEWCVTIKEPISLGEHKHQGIGD
jgi:hypothetical protein